LAHESIIDRLIPIENLAMHLPLVIVSDLAARLWKHSPDRQQELHLLWLENSALGCNP
jgi:hypothetical protein